MTTYQSHLMSVYNKARASDKLDPSRVNRAFGILQGIERDITNYHATTRACSCPDAKFGNICKHRIARMIQVRVREREDSAVYERIHYENVRKK